MAKMISFRLDEDKEQLLAFVVAATGAEDRSELMRRALDSYVDWDQARQAMSLIQTMSLVKEVNDAEPAS